MAASATCSSRQKCLSSPDSYCYMYICVSFTIPNQKVNVCAFVKSLCCIF